MILINFGNWGEGILQLLRCLILEIYFLEYYFGHEFILSAIELLSSTRSTLPSQVDYNDRLNDHYNRQCVVEDLGDF